MDANITCDLGDGDISRLGVAYLTHVIHTYIASSIIVTSILTRATHGLLSWAAAFSDGCYLAHVNGAYLRHVKFCIVKFVHHLAYLSTWAATHFNSARLVQSPRRRRWRGWTNVQWNTCVPYFSIMWWAAFFDTKRSLIALQWILLN